MIVINDLSKTFSVHQKEPGMLGSLRGLFYRKYTVKAAVDSVSLRIDEGELVGLVGANGAGKTTLVKMLAGIIYPSSGEAKVLGYTPWERDNRLRRQIALIMGQKAQLWWDLPASDCFTLLREIYEIPDDQFKKTLGELVEMLGVGSEMNTQIRRLSLGERMKMELIAALLHRPKVVYLDEPTIGLDITAQKAMRDFIKIYRAEHKPAMILTSHYMEDIERLCERILIMRQGRLVHDGRLDSVVKQYAPERFLTLRWIEGQVPDFAAAPTPSRETMPGARDSLKKIEALGRVVSCDAVHLRLAVPRAEVTSRAVRLLQEFPIADFTVEDTDIGTVIESIMLAKGESLPTATPPDKAVA